MTDRSHRSHPGQGSRSSKRSSQRRRLPQTTKGRWLAGGSLVLAAVILGGLAGVAFASMIKMPQVDTLADFTPSQITKLLDRGGEPIATFARERRVLIKEGELPELVQNAVLAAEDRNFFQHGGVDAEGVLRAILLNLASGPRSFGGSTVTMQLSRSLFLHPKKLWRRKVEEALLAVEIEKKFSKEQILTLYCNFMYLGHGNYGIQAAAQSFFGKDAAELDAAEAAALVGMLQRPSDYSPYRRPDLVVKRRNYVLRRMREENFLDEATYQEATAQPLEVLPPSREYALAPYFAEEIRKAVEDSHGTQAILEQGLRIESTLDTAMQAAAQRALRDGLRRIDRLKGWRGAVDSIGLGEEPVRLESWSPADYQPGAWNLGVVLAASDREATVQIGEREYRMPASEMRWTRKSKPSALFDPGDVAWFSILPPDESESETGPRRVALEQEPELEGAVLVLESASGAVRAMVGGWNFEGSKFNRATQARRQVGSAFKPFVFGAALESGFTPADTVFDAPVAFPGPTGQVTYSPRNYYRSYYGITTLRRALELSMNVTAVKLQDLVGVERVVDFARRAGIESDLPPYPSLALGAADLSPLELASAYAAIANQGIWVRPYLVERVVTPGGRVLEEHATQARKATEPQVAYLLTRMLEGVVDRGTATAVKSLDLDLAGKTGTTDDYSDAWFVGFTPKYTILSWVGYDQKRKIGRNMTGAEAALPIWRAVVEAGLEEGWLTPDDRFVQPPGITTQAVEYYSGLLAAPGADKVLDEAFLEGTEPVLRFEAALGGVHTLPWYQQRPYYVAKARERMPEQVESWEPILSSWSN